MAWLNHFHVTRIEEALSEAQEECRREPTTDLWRSFWDRLTEGRYIPPQPFFEE